jgi:hypothetical protein
MGRKEAGMLQKREAVEVFPTRRDPVGETNRTVTGRSSAKGGHSRTRRALASPSFFLMTR